MMMPQHLLIAVVLPTVVAAFAVRPSFLGTTIGDSCHTTVAIASSNSRWHMDIETDSALEVTRYNLEQALHRHNALELQFHYHHNEQHQQPRRTGFVSVSEAEAVHGMPWKTSIEPKVDEEPLYMPFWEWQMSFMKESLTDLRAIPCTNGKDDFSYQENSKKKARIVNLCATSKEYRKIRMSYYDAGDNTQVFNSVWYPDPAYNLPVLGIDLLAFNRKKYLAIVDFQPLYAEEDEHAAKYEHLLEPIKDQYEALKGRMSSKFYDETQFFSKQMLFARFEDEGVISKELFPAFQEYVKTHLQLLQNTEPDLGNAKKVLERQKAYDTYSAERDPATGLFAAMFGNEWAQDFVHDFLFSMSERSAEPRAPPSMAFMGGGGGGNPHAQSQSHNNQPSPQQHQPQAASLTIPANVVRP
jgi:15,16-dihydrobiliverdin:ferredoxin oxidoreductase